MIIKVPATTTNLGPGLDSLGMAVSLYLEVEIISIADRFQVDHAIPNNPHDENNLIVKAALTTYPGLAPLHLRVKSNIPLGCGFNSDSSAIIAGIEVANQVGKLGLTDQEKIQLGAKIAQRIGSIAPAVVGGLVVGTPSDEHVDWISLPLPPYELVAYMPQERVPLKKLKNAMPQTVGFERAVHSSAVANGLVASLFAQKYKIAGELLEEDLLQEPYRKQLVPELDKVRAVAHQKHALATYLSGAGPTIMTWIKEAHAKGFLSGLRKHDLKGATLILHPSDGVQVIE